MNINKFKAPMAIATSFVLLSSSFSFATPTVFTDISGHWAEDHIEDVYERKIISGYEDATYRPGGNITKLEAVIISAKLMGYSSSESQYYISQYSSALSDNNIPSWAQGEVAYALFNDIISEEDLKDLVSTNKQTYAKRQDIAIYIGRVLEYGAGEKLKSIYSIPYDDEMIIPDDIEPYIDLLLRKDILNKTSNNGRFLPNNAISRAEVAKIVSLSAEILDGNSSGGNTTPDNKEDDDTESNDKVETEIISGYVDSIIKGSRNVISIVDGDESHIHNIDEDADITLDNRKADVDKIKKGQNVTVVIEDNIIVSIEAEEAEEVTEGYFYYFLTGQEDQVHIQDKNDDDEIIKFVLTNNSEVYLDDESIDVRDVKFGDIVTIKHIGEEIVELEIEPKEKSLEGVVKDIYEEDDDEYVLEVLLEDDNIEEFIIDSDTDIRRDRKSVDYDEIKIDDEVELELEYDKVIEVNAFSVQKTIEGFIKGISIGEKTEITVEDYDGNTEVFEVTPKAEIIIEEERAGIYDLRPNYEVEIDLENNEVVWIESYRKLQGVTYEGKVLDVDYRDDIFEMEISRKEELEIEIDDDTIIIDENGDTIRLRDINEDDEILVYGQDNGYYVLATRILVLIPR